jgi:hypothetical protein
LPPDIRVPGIPAVQRVFIEPHLDAVRAQCLRDATRGGGIFAGIAQKYGTDGVGSGHGVNAPAMGEEFVRAVMLFVQRSHCRIAAAVPRGLRRANLIAGQRGSFLEW